MKKLVLFTLSFMLSLNIISQASHVKLDATSQVMNTLQEHILSINEKTLTIEDEDKGVVDLTKAKGSPFLDTEFMPGQVYIISQNKALGFQMRYNIYSDEIEILDSENDKLVPVIKDKDISVTLGNNHFIYCEYIDKNGISKKGYFVELYKGKVLLLLKYKSKFSPFTPAASPILNDKPARFTTVKDYFLLNADKITYLPQQKKKLIEALDKDKIKLENFIKKNNIKLSNENDLIKLVEFYDTI